ncbi:MAG: hypothetical protein IV106_23175 [Pseudomonas umsongensis]|nr:hypothetical protein [Pseudomonas umsongensis]
MIVNNPHCLINADRLSQSDELNYPSGVTIDRYESIYAVLSRFALANTLTKRDIISLFKGRVPSYYSGSRGLGNQLLIKSEQVVFSLGVSESQLNEMFYSWHPVLRVTINCLYFRYCSICASVHRHYTIFQAEALRKCPFHFLYLRTDCAYCGESMLYDWSSRLLSFPFRCAHCHEPLGVKHGSKVFFDLHTEERARRLAWVNGLRSAAQPINDANVCPSGADENACPGYLVYGARNADFDQWCAMVNLPLHGRNWTDKDWSSCAGYIQIRGPRVRTGRKRVADDAASDSAELTSYLMQCLKSILRNLRQCWKIESQQFRKARPVDTQNSLQRYREEAFSLLLRHWCGKSKLVNLPGHWEGNSYSWSMINNWLSATAKNVDRRAGPKAILVWLLAHQFCAWVVESITTIAGMIDRPSAIPDSCLLEQIQLPRKPLWLVAFIESAACTSYRVIHYHHYPSCLSSAEVWYGANDVD